MRLNNMKVYKIKNEPTICTKCRSQIEAEEKQKLLIILKKTVDCPEAENLFNQVVKEMGDN